VGLHGGTITCDDVPDGGTLFTVRLPLPRALPPLTDQPRANPANGTFT
jgi:signal transduction histidine kinase